MTCPYCDEPAELVTGARLYAHRSDLAAKVFWRCDGCDAHVGCHHDDPARPLGRMANAMLRKAKMAAHAAFDPFWKSQGWKRGQAYRWLAGVVGVEPENAHIGMFDEVMCRRVVEAVATESHAKASR